MPPPISPPTMPGSATGTMSDPVQRPRHRTVRLGCCLLLGCLVWRASPDPAGSNPGQPASPPPPPPPLPALELDDDAPLLLDDENGGAPLVLADPGGHGVDINAACYVCHVNFKADPFVQRHARADIGCAKCHGASRAHVDDEANLTPPEVMYWPSRIGASCLVCHPTHNAPARDVILRWQERCPEKTNPNHLVCTDCHGNHRLALRTIVWNQRSGELVSKGRPINVRAANSPLRARLAEPVGEPTLVPPPAASGVSPLKTEACSHLAPPSTP